MRWRAGVGLWETGCVCGDWSRRAWTDPMISACRVLVQRLRSLLRSDQSASQPLRVTYGSSGRRRLAHVGQVGHLGRRVLV